MATIVVCYDPDPQAAAKAADRALEGHGYHVSLVKAATGVEICITAHNQLGRPTAYLRSGQQLVVESSGSWRIEAVPEVAP